jgi:hypothetical protein
MVSLIVQYLLPGIGNIKAKTHHHPLKKHAVLTTVINHAKAICDTESVSDKIRHLRKTFRQNGYNAAAFSRAMNKKHKTAAEKERLVGVASLPFRQSTSYKISRLLGKLNIKMVSIPAKRSSHMLRPVKDDLGLKVSGVYSIPCQCGEVFIEQTGQSFETRGKENE